MKHTVTGQPQATLQRIGAKIFWWHTVQSGRIQDPVLDHLPSDRIVEMLQTLLRKGLNPCEPCDDFCGRHASLFHYAASMNWHNVCYLFVDHGADPTAGERSPLNLFGRGLWRGNWEALPLPSPRLSQHCEEMLRRRAVYLEQQWRENVWQRRRHAMVVLSEHGFLLDKNVVVDTLSSLPPISRKSIQENWDYLLGSVLANPLIRLRIISFL